MLVLQPLLEKFFLSVSGTFAPVDRVFSQSGLTMRPMEKLVSQLDFLKCNSHLR